MDCSLQRRQVNAQIVRFQHIDHVGQHGDRLVVQFALTDYLQREKEAFFQPRGIDQAQYMLDVGISEGLFELGHRHLFLC